MNPVPLGVEGAGDDPAKASMIKGRTTQSQPPGGDRMLRCQRPARQAVVAFIKNDSKYREKQDFFMAITISAQDAWTSKHKSKISFPVFFSCNFG
jgi:siroheme synthase (precorrin-2 oxidase/ferrochelatase)